MPLIHIFNFLDNISPMCLFWECFRRCSALQELELDDCQLGDDGLLALCPILPSLPHLEFLGISSNSFTARGMLEFFATLPRCPQIANVDLSWNSIWCGEVAEAALVLLSSCKTLKVLQLGICGLDNTAKTSLQAAWAASHRHPAGLFL